MLETLERLNRVGALLLGLVLNQASKSPNGQYACGYAASSSPDPAPSASDESMNADA